MRNHSQLTRTTVTLKSRWKNLGLPVLPARGPVPAVPMRYRCLSARILAS